MNIFKRIPGAISILLILSIFTNCQSVTEPDESAGGDLFVLNSLGETVSLINLESGEVTEQFLNAGDIPADVALYQDQLFILNSTPPSLDIFHAPDQTRTASVSFPEGSNPYSLLITDERIFISGLLSDKVYILNSENNYTLVDSIGVGTGPEGMEMDSENLYVACTGGWLNNYASAAVHVISRSSLQPVDTIATHANPQRMAWSSDGMLHVVCTGNYADVAGSVNVINPLTMSVETEIPLGGAPGNIIITKNDMAYLSDFGISTETDSTGYLYSYDAENYQIHYDSQAPILVGFGAGGLAYDAQLNRLFIANFGLDTVDELNLDDLSVAASFQVGDGPQSLAFRVPAGN